ncbi:MAG: phage holin family protein [Actinomycetaceae bacterium]|nr:phage holin family protein [Actinomycetaceae bacterium]
MNFIARLAANAAGLWVAAWLIKGISIPQASPLSEQLLVIGVIALIFTLVQTVVKPFMKIVTFPLYVVTFGLWALVVNAVLLIITSKVTESLGHGLHVDSFGAAVLGGIITAVVASIVNAVIRPKN